ncbi:MAG: hypothetical protein ACYCX2_12190 [Christensenellales bacterium]
MAKLSITVTFKDHEKWLYDKVSQHSSKGAHIKDILKLYYKEKEDTKLDSISKILNI